MLELTRAFVVVAFIGLSFADEEPTKCPNGRAIFEYSDSEQDTEDVVALVNKYRYRISKGLVPGLPRGVDLKKLSADAHLAQIARQSSYACTVEHPQEAPVDERWTYIRRNACVSSYKTKNIALDWSTPIDLWINNGKGFSYPKKYNGKHIDSYLQLIWANTTKVGCDSILYHEPTNLQYPYYRVYNCFFGPGAIMNKAPYKTA